VLTLMGQVFSQMTARKYYQPAVAGLSYSFSLGTRYTYFACWSGANFVQSSFRAGVQSPSSPTADTYVYGVIVVVLPSRGVGLSFYGYSPKLVDFAAEVSRDVGDPSFWASISPSVVDMCKDRLLRTLRSCKPKVFQYTLLCGLPSALSVATAANRDQRETGRPV
jgi:hypothetical protein